MAPATAKRPTVRSYACRVKDHSHEETVHATTASKARYAYFLDIRDCLPDLKIMDIRVRSLGGPVTTDRFARCAAYRGVPFARVGMRVEVGGKPGMIVGHNSSANFNVLFDGEDVPLNCHPNWMIAYFDEEGREIARFDR